MPTVIRDPFADYFVGALAEFVPHAGFARVARRPVDGAASGPARIRQSRSQVLARPATSAEDQRASREATGAVPSTAAPARREPPERVHGTLTGYTTYGCRCDLCREAMSIYHAERRLRRAGLIA
jgi:hypothetical protein